MSHMKKLKKIRAKCGEAQTKGLADHYIEEFLDKDSKLGKAIEEAYERFEEQYDSHADWFQKSEQELIDFLQEDLLNFYKHEAINPYVALAARGPWIITTHGAVIHDSGGYGMLGFAHGPKNILHAMNENVVMANVMTASFVQRRFTDKLRQEIGHRREGKLRHPYDKFLCLNSGSESMTVALRIVDINTRVMLSGKQQGKTVKTLSLKGSFHGRTERPALASDSTRKAGQAMASFGTFEHLITVEPNDVDGLKKAFQDAKKNNVFIESVLMEPVMGEGNPGMAMKREFYDVARQLASDNDAMLIVDSIQAGFRSHGCLSLMDYPGFETCQPPDMETYSKALNAGQYPLSVLALTQRAAGMYKTGVYGNTMTSNPRALEVACAVLDSFTPSIRANIQERGQEFVHLFNTLREEFPEAITNVQGTGLLVSLELAEKGYTVLGPKECVERYLRENGIGVIHGGKNALRFTPHFRISSDEVALIVENIRTALKRGPIYT